MPDIPAIARRARVPIPLVLLAGAAVASAAIPRVNAPAEHTVERLLTVCLLGILFDGGMQIGRRRLQPVLGSVVVVGVAGTFLTAAGVATFAHWTIALDWYDAVLLGSILAPTDPAVVFSVLGRQDGRGRASTILEGESGANDPVGIALVASLLSAGTLTGGSVGHVLRQFALQMGAGAVIGVVAGSILLWLLRRITLPSVALYPACTIAAIAASYFAAVALHGSGFLAVFLAGIVVGDEETRGRQTIARVHQSLAGLAEIAAFVTLGLTITLRDLVRVDVWVPAVAIAVVLAAVIRPAAVGLCLARARLQRDEVAFVLLAGLKGAVPLLLGTKVLDAPVHDRLRLYSIVVDVVVLSVLVQGSLTGWWSRRSLADSVGS